MSLIIDSALARRLVDEQFPQWKDLPIRSVKHGGWDNRTFHLGTQMLIRMPSAERYAAKVEVEQYWLPKLAPFLPLPIPAPIAMGMPTTEYPWYWSIYTWIEGETAAHAAIHNLDNFAQSLALFLLALQRIDVTGGPQPGLHNFYRGGSLHVYDIQTRQALTLLQHKIDIKVATNLWEKALSTSWKKRPVWLHGDISLGNLLVVDGKLSAVIDFGGLAVGDPACDTSIAWTVFKETSREIFLSTLNLDKDTYIRGQAWALWKASIIAAGIIETNAVEREKSWYVIDEVLTDFQV